MDFLFGMMTVQLFFSIKNAQSVNSKHTSKPKIFDQSFFSFLHETKRRQIQFPSFFFLQTIEAKKLYNESSNLFFHFIVSFSSQQRIH